MMSNPPSSLQNRQKLHRRQNSTPLAFEATNGHMPPTQTQRQPTHRRGQSYDMARSPIRRHQHTGSAVSMNTNLGSIQGQQILREAQQQRMTRPGQQQIQPRIDTSAAQQCGMYPLPQSSPYDMTMSAMLPSPTGPMHHSRFNGMQVPASANSQSSYMFDENDQNYFQAMHSIPEASQMVSMHDRRMSQPDLRIHTGLRPYTPTQQIQTASFPLTPAQTPMNQRTRQQRQDENIVSPRPVSMQKSRSLQGIAEHQELDAFVDSNVSFPAKLPSSTEKEPTKPQISQKEESKDLFGEITADAPSLQDQTQPLLPSSQPPSSPTRPALSPRRISISDLGLDPGTGSIAETNVSVDDIAQFIDGPDEENKYTCSFEGCHRTFGRKENIKSHIQTHLGDRQFRCNHCDKCFVRGHDLKRHAKIHTGQKAYACLCGNAFARHDALTRHRQRGMCIGAFEGIVRKEIKRGRPRKHRPEMEDRLDKASRSRTKKQASGSPGKDGDMYASSASSCSISSWGSPPTDTMDHLSIHDGSVHSPPMNYDDHLNLFGLSPQDMEMGPQSLMNTTGHLALPPDMFSFTPPASPGYSTGNKPSPFHREVTPAELVSFNADPNSVTTAGQPVVRLDLIPDHSSSQVQHQPQTIAHSTLSLTAHAHFDLPTMAEAQHEGMANTQATSLPSLSHSSSPPPQENGPALVFDFPDDASALRMSTMSNISFGLSAMTKGLEAGSLTQTSGEDSQRNEFDSFLDYNDDSQMSLGMGMGNDDAFFASL